MIEGTPQEPFGPTLDSLLEIERNIAARRERVRRALAALYDGEHCEMINMSNYPLLGCSAFTDPPAETSPCKGLSGSLFFPDAAVFHAHTKMEALTKNLIARRGSRFSINVPLFVDDETKLPFREDFQRYGDDGQAARDALPNHVYMDCLGFGAGCCCLQVTFQAPDECGARWLHDQLACVSPIALALTAACPFFRGYVTDVDSRWNVFADCVDDRTEEERGLRPLDECWHRIAGTRFISLECYLAEGGAKYNDEAIVLDEKYRQELIANGWLEGDGQSPIYLILFLKRNVNREKQSRCR